MGSTRFSSVLILAMLCVGCAVGGPERGLPRATTQEVRAAKLLDEGRVDEAQAVFFQAAQLNPRPFIASIGVARCASARGNWSMVTRALQQAYGAAPKTPEANDLLGRTHLEVAKVTSGGMRIQHASTAASLFSAASRVAPDLPSLAYHTGMSELLAGRTKEAITFLTLAVREDATDDAIHALVLAYKRVKQKRAVIALLEPMEKEGRLPPSLAKELAWARTPSAGVRGKSPGSKR